MHNSFIDILEDGMKKLNEPKKFSYTEVTTLDGGNIQDFMLFLRDRENEDVKDLTRITFVDGEVDYLHTFCPQTGEENIIPYDVFLSDWELVVVKRKLEEK